MTRHRYRPPAWPWWPGATAGAVPHVVPAGYLVTAGLWARVFRGEVYVVAAAVLLTLLPACFRRSRRVAIGLLGATAVGVAAVVGVAITR